MSVCIVVNILSVHDHCQIRTADNSIRPTVYLIHCKEMAHVVDDITRFLNIYRNAEESNEFK